MHQQRSPKKPIFPPRLKAWLVKHFMSVAIIAGAVIVTVVFLYALAVVDTSVPSPTYSTQKPKEKYYSPMTGLEVPDKAQTELAVTGVMIENSPESRPQSGLKDAGTVYEATAEGGVTRFMALYQQDKPELIGPVRSLRIYYLDWAAPYQASIAHVGGSYNALETVRGGGYRDIDQFFNAGAYWRANDRYAPHNMYTSGANLDQLNNDKGYKASSFTSFNRADEKPAQEPTAASVQVNFSGPAYATSYSYEHETNSYARFLAGQPHNDREKGQITPKVVVVIKVNAQSRGGSDGYEDLTTSGSGQAYVFQNGTVTELTWQKANRDSALTLTESNGEPFTLVRGQTWVSAITDRGSVAWQ